jgi:hypothetical protein
MCNTLLEKVEADLQISTGFADRKGEGSRDSQLGL